MYNHFSFETRFHFVAQAVSEDIIAQTGFKFRIFLPRPPKGLNYRRVTSQLSFTVGFSSYHYIFNLVETSKVITQVRQPGHAGLVPEAVHFPVNPRMQTNRITNNSLACEPNSKDSPSTYHQDMCQGLPACVRHKPATWRLLFRKMTHMWQALFQGD